MSMNNNLLYMPLLNASQSTVHNNTQTHTLGSDLRSHVALLITTAIHFDYR